MFADKNFQLTEEQLEEFTQCEKDYAVQLTGWSSLAGALEITSLYDIRSVFYFTLFHIIYNHFK